MEWSFTGSLRSSLPSWLPHSQSGPRTTLAPWKVPFNVIRVRFCRGLTTTLKNKISKQIYYYRSLHKALFQPRSFVSGPSVPYLEKSMA